MRRHRNESPVSLFSFQDIIMSVVGIVILITLLLILKLVTQMSLAEATPEPATASAKELEELIESLKPSLREIQDEIIALHEAQQKSQAWAPSPDQIDALQSMTERLETEIEEVRQLIENADKHTEELKKDQSLKLADEKEKHVQQLKEILKQTEKQCKELEQQKEIQEKAKELQAKEKELQTEEKELQAKERELRTKNMELDQKLAAETIPQLILSARKSSDKTPYILIYGGNRIEVLSIDGSAKKNFTSRSQFYSWANSCNKRTEYFVLFVRPSRFDRYEEVLGALKSKGFDIGLQVIGETTNFSIEK
jgi:myosin heavy subunit